MMVHSVPLACINHAADHFHVPALMIIAVMTLEQGRSGMAVQNKNHTEDLGVMQINSSWLPILSKQGITRHDLQYNSCTNVTVGTWILAQEMARESGWQGIGNYHSHTARYNQAYRVQVKQRYVRYISYLQGNDE